MEKLGFVYQSITLQKPPFEVIVGMIIGAIVLIIYGVMNARSKNAVAKGNFGTTSGSVNFLAYLLLMILIGGMAYLLSN